jgi:hypothetical protein
LYIAGIGKDESAFLGTSDEVIAIFGGYSDIDRANISDVELYSPDGGCQKMVTFVGLHQRAILNFTPGPEG